MSRLLIDQTPDYSQYLVDHADGSMAFQVTADVTANIEDNKRLQTLNDGYSPSRDLRRVASIPLAVAVEWHDRYGVDVLNKDHTEAVKRLLRDPDWRHLRTSPGRI